MRMATMSLATGKQRVTPQDASNLAIKFDVGTQ